MVADILIELKAKNIVNTFTYLIPKDMHVEVGMRVLVPFGKQTLEGFVLKIKDLVEIDYKLKSIISCIDENPVLNKEMLELGVFMQNKTLCSLITCYQTMLPKALKAKNGVVVNKKYNTYLIINNEIEPILKNDKQVEIYNLIKEKNKILKKEVNDISTSSVKTLLNKNYIIEIKEEDYRIHNNVEIKESNIKLNNEQQKVVNSVLNDLNKFSPFLLYGVTGSGKTEVYMHIIKEVINKKEEALLLVPEISLTPQIVSLFKERFGDEIAILHSGLNDGEKYDEWRKIERKEVKIVIGARSAVFAPLTNIGCIIIDEEHSDTYKQENNPKYNAIDIALHRAQYHNCPIILGSATPKIESYTRANLGVYKLLTMKNRVNNNLPKITLVDMQKELKNGNRILSKLLTDKVNDRLSRNEQVILLLNRRGYNTVITCHDCGYTQKCPRCDIPLTYHKSSNTMRCHYCGYGDKKMITCPACHSDNINNFGLGTQKLEEEITKLFNTSVVRMDVDTTSTKGAHEKILNDFRNKKYSILIGTQMIAKGLDFANVTLVGVLNGDASLNIPDYRSAERTYSLLNQVAGRSGRGNLPGEVIIQGFNIDHYSIVLASKHDYETFYSEEMKIRKKLIYPPYCNLALIRIMGKNYDSVVKESDKIANYLNSNLNKKINILGPSSANMPKMNDIYYFQIILKYKDTKEIKDSLKFILEKYQNNRNINIDVDFCPYKI